MRTTFAVNHPFRMHSIVATQPPPLPPNSMSTVGATHRQAHKPCKPQDMRRNNYPHLALLVCSAGDAG